MIRAENVTMQFGAFKALDKLNCQIPKGCVYGLSAPVQAAAGQKNRRSAQRCSCC